MEASLVFQIVNTLVLPAWLILIFFPKKTWRNSVIYIFASFMALVYAYYVATGLGQFDMETFSTLEGIKAAFASDQAVLTGWIHYLVFDLLVGNWIVNNAQRNQLKHYFIIPCLFFCFLFGPVGFLLYSLLKLSLTKSLQEVPKSE